MPKANRAKNNRVLTLIKKNKSLVVPGVYDALSALLAERAGFPLLFVSGYSVAASKLGEPDVGLLTQTECLERAREICRAVRVPVIVDADTGYGNALNVIRTVNELIDFGAAGCILEDQVWPKRCGHMRGKKVVPRREFLGKLEAALDARGNRDFFIIARTDAIAADSFGEALARAQAAEKLGVDACFVEAPQSLAQLKKIGQSLRLPLLANMVEGGKTPLLDREQLEALGFELIVYPVAGLFTAAAALQLCFSHLARNGNRTFDTSPQFGFDAFGDLVGLPQKYALAERYE